MDDATTMGRAISNADEVRAITSPNPWVGAVVTATDGSMFDGATHPPGGPHAEVVALTNAGAAATGATLTVTLEPCVHDGRTPPCTDAIVGAGVARVVVGIGDPDPRVAGLGVAALRAAGLDVSVGVRSAEIMEQLRPYLTHRRTGRPFVVLKLAVTVDGRTALSGGASQWITGPQARADVHRLRAQCDAVLVGAGTVRADDPSLTVRHVEGRDPLRVVLGHAPTGARIRPCREMSGDLGDVLDELGRDGIIQLLVEGGATVAGDFHRAGLVDWYVLYVAPALAGGDDGVAMFTGAGAASMDQLWRGRFRSVVPLGDDLRIEMEPTSMQRTVGAYAFRNRQLDAEQKET